MEYLPYIGSVFVALGVAKLLQMAYAARIDRRKIKHDLDVTNSGKQIDADVNAFDAINTRLALVEARLDKVNEQLTSQLVENAKLEAENKRLSSDNDRLEKEVERQRDRIHGLAGDIQSRDLQITELKIMVERLTAEVRAMNGHTISTDDTIKVELVEHE